MGDKSLLRPFSSQFMGDKSLLRPYRYPKGTQNVDITHTSFAEGFFDAIISIHVLEHIPDDSAALRELYRILKADGWAIIMVPINKGLKETFEDSNITDPVAREKAFGQSDHVRLYGADFSGRLRKAGFQVTTNDVYSLASEEERKRMSLLPGEEIFFCTKKKR